MNSEQFLRRLENRFSIGIEDLNLCVGILDGTFPFDEQWVLATQSTILFAGLDDFLWSTHAIQISDDVFAELCQIVRSFPVSSVNNETQVFGGAELLAVSLEHHSLMFHNARLPADPEDQVEVWCTKFADAIAKTGGVFAFAREKKHEVSASVLDLSTPIVNLELPVRVRAAILRIGGKTLEDLRRIDLTKLENESGYSKQELFVMLSAVVSNCADDLKER